MEMPEQGEPDGRRGRVVLRQLRLLHPEDEGERAQQEDQELDEHFGV